MQLLPLTQFGVMGRLERIPAVIGSIVEHSQVTGVSHG